MMFKQWMAGLLALWSIGAWAEDLCAVVLIEIAQELTLERQAFEATMRINNGLDTIALDNLAVQVLFEDDKGNVVKASSDPNATDAAFFIRLDDSQNVNSVQSGTDGAVTSGQVPAKASGELRWLIIPTAGAAGQSLAGKRYMVGASLSYNAGGKLESLTVTPDSITVKPQPQLTLDYFLTQQVIADDAFTPEIEAPEPYTLGVRIRNSGYGEAKSVKLESAQPKIVGNEQGLAINFRINQSFVDEAPAVPTLLLDFGAVAPGKNRNGRWLMESTLSGKFIDFSASFSHPDELGGRLTSLLDAANAHFLLRDVLVDLPTRDRIRDYLALVGDEPFVFESDSSGQAANAPCLDCTAVNRLPASLIGNNTLRELAVSSQAGFGYIKVADPYAGQKGLQRVVRGNGTALSPYNVWLSKERAADGRTFNYFLNVFDTQPDSRYTVEFGELTQEPKPPVFQFITDRSTFEGGQVGFLVRASDPNGTVPKLSAEGLPVGASFKDEGQGRGTFYWAPLQGQAGRYVVNFKASDGALETRLPVGVQVFRQGDSDGDGMDDDWEREHFANLDRDGNGDFDGDGILDRDEFERGTDPETVEQTPLPPQLYIPADNAEVTELYPSLRVQNSISGQGRSLDYWFELYADEGMTQLLAKSAAIGQGSNHTEWVVEADQLEPNAELQDNRRYYWRVRVSHASGSSEWLNGRFFINSVNDAPSAPVLLNPTPMGQVAQTQPTFQFNNSLDVDEDALTYRVRVFSEDDAEFTQPVAEVSGLLPGANGVTKWQSPVALEENRFYLWLVEARDEHDAVTLGEPSLFGVSLSNDAPSAPGLAWPLNSQTIDQAKDVLLRLDRAKDPERQPLSYRIQLDTNERFDSGALLDSDWFSAGQDGVHWTLPAELKENQTYYWRARASDGEQESAWVAGSFRVNQFQEAPAAPTVSNPAGEAWVEVRSPRLEVHPAQDPDGDALSYEFALYAAEGDEPLASQVVSELNWTPAFALDDNNWYRWRVRTLDATGLVSPWSDWLRFFVNENGTDDAPGLSFVQPVEELAMTGGSVLLQWTDQDPDSAASIELYANDRLIASGLAEDADGDTDRFEWSLAGFEPGIYRLKAVIRDATQAVTVEVCCSITLLPVTPEVRVRPVTALQLDEYGETVAEIEVSLDRSPKAGQSITLNLALSDTSEARLLNAPPYLYFTAENWRQPQRIRVQGVDDCAIDGSQNVGLELLPLQSSDSDFAGLDPQDVLLTTADNEQAGQTLFVCHYQVVSRGEVGSDGQVNITLRPELLNTGVALTEATATPSVQGAGVSLSGATSVRFSKVLNGIRSQAYDTIVLRQPADQPVLFNRLHWAVTPGAAAPVTQGQQSDDTLVGGTTDDIIDGGAGNDLIKGGAGDDLLVGGRGADVLQGEAGDDIMVVVGTDSSADHFSGGEGFDQVLGGDGDDVIRLQQFVDDMRVERIDGRDGRNRIEGTAQSDVLNFTDTELLNIELIYGLGGDDTILGSRGNDVIRGGGGNDVLAGNGGDDSFLYEGSEGTDSLSGGEGNDRILGSAKDDWIRLKTFTPTTSVETIDGGEGQNFLTGDNSANVFDFRQTQIRNIARIDGLGGNDSIFGSAGPDMIQGGGGNDTLSGEGGDDIFPVQGRSSGFDTFTGGEGRDGIKGSSGDDVFGLASFSGEQRVEWIDGDGGLNRILGTATADQFDFRDTRLIGINEIDLGKGDDSLVGSADSDVIIGGPGDDSLYGLGGDDRFLVSGRASGYDLFDGGEGQDSILGDEGDTVFGLSGMAKQQSIELIDGRGGVNRIVAREEADVLDFQGVTLNNIAQIEGRGDDDQLRGSSGDDVLVGGRGSDQLFGAAGNDSYVFAKGDGVDYILEMGLPTDFDRLQLNVAYSLQRIWFTRKGDDLHISMVGTTDAVVLAGVFTSEANRIEQIELATGDKLSAANAVILAQVMAGMPADPHKRTKQQKTQLASALQQSWSQP